MMISDEVNYSKLQSTIYKELKSHGVKHRIKKITCKNAQPQKKIFGAPLGSVPTCTVQCCGNKLQVPAIVPELCSVLRTNLHMEGLFRKAGSQVRQKDIRSVLDSGGPVYSDAHPVDVASVLKLYLRTLPVALVPSEVQEVLVRCRVLAGPGHSQLLLHALLLLPVMHLHLLHYLMEFLNSVASKHSENRMDVTNLAIVMTPSVMPLPVSAPTQRLDHHVALVKFMIENASLVGRMSEELVWRLGAEGGEGGGAEAETRSDERRKKRRSGSLTRMLSGLRKIVGGGERCSNKTPDPLVTPRRPPAPRAAPTTHTPRPLATPVLTKSAVKRKTDSCTGLSTKSKHKVMKNLPQSSLSFTPLRPKGSKEHKKLRLSLVGRSRKSKSQSNEHLVLENTEDTGHNDAAIFPDCDIDLSDAKESDYVRISKHEYEDIKSRVSAIENRLSQELDGFFPAKEPVHQVQTAYEKTLEGAAMLNSSSSEHLARRLSKELKIRQSVEHKVIRSPSARKIGTIRRRSKDNGTKLSRNKSWNVSTLSQSGANCTSQFYPLGLKRGRPNTVMTGLPQTNLANTFIDSNNSKQKKTVCETLTHTVNSNISSSSNVSSNSNHSYNTRNQGKQQPKKEPANWISAASFLRSEERLHHPLTGRASVNQLRNQNAGMVLAKAKIFDQISDSDSSLEKKTYSTRQLNGNTVFARKPRTIGNTAAPNQLALHTSSASSTPRLSKIKESAHQTRSPVSKRNRMRSVLSKENASTTPESPSVAGQKTPRSTPYIRKPLTMKSTRNLRTPMSEVRRQTPLRAVHAAPLTPSHNSSNYPQIRVRQLL